MSLTFTEFVQSPYLRNSWIAVDGGNLNVYVRKFNRLFPEGITTIDLASFTADVQGTGSLRRFLDEVEPEFSVFIENVYDERLQKFFLDREYKIAEAQSMRKVVDHDILCFYKICPDDEDAAGVAFDIEKTVEVNRDLAAKKEIP